MNSAIHVEALKRREKEKVRTHEREIEKQTENERERSRDREKEVDREYRAVELINCMNLWAKSRSYRISIIIFKINFVVETDDLYVSC